MSEEKAVVSIFDRGFLYGDGLFETIRIFNGKPFRWEQHMERLRNGADFLRMKLPFSARALRAFADELIDKNKMPNALLRINLSRGAGTAGYSPKGARKPTIAMSLRRPPKVDPARLPQWKLITSSFRIAANDPLARFKTCNKLPQILARAEADDAGMDEALLLNTEGFVSEGTSSNVFWVRWGGLCTPPLSAGILPGITREVVFEVAASLGIAVREKNIPPKDLGQADGIFLSLSSWSIVEAVALDKKPLSTSPLTRQIQRGCCDLLNRS